MSYKVFVYGTLKSGQSNHRLLEGAHYVGQAVTIRPFHLLDNGGFPVVIDERKHPVAGEVYEVDGAILSNLDRLEGHPTWYKREEVTVDLGDTGVQETAWMYIGTPKGWGNAAKRLPSVKENTIGVANWQRG
jgi:gamma-glutamylcyclotransferase (GGCT)/AIG2-like uncharacterized protein YtfP